MMLRRFSSALAVAVSMAVMVSGCGDGERSGNVESAASTAPAGSSGSSDVDEVSRFCEAWEIAGEQAAALRNDGSSSSDQPLGGLREFMEFSYNVMTELSGVAPSEIRGEVELLRDYYRAELDSGLEAPTPDGVDIAEHALSEWVDAKC